MSESKSQLSRRHVFAGAGALGALAVGAAALPLVRKVEPLPPEPAKAELDPAGGYQVTPHVLHYYRTARV